MSYGHNFRAWMPREKPEEGKAFIVVSVKDSDGNRVEFEGAIDKDRAFKLFGEALVPNK
ncbi:MAG: hypothetical protein V4501_08300 [Pseudomonadota bacterium]